MSVAPESYDEALARLTGPGSLFELRTEDVRGRPMRNFAKRPKSLYRSRLPGRRAAASASFWSRADRRISYAEFAKLVLGHGTAFPGAGRLSRRATAWRFSLTTASTT